MSKKKPKTISGSVRGLPIDFGTPRASSFCDLCTLEKTAGPHRCGRRDITPAEQTVIDCAMALASGLSSSAKLYAACRELERER